MTAHAAHTHWTALLVILGWAGAAAAQTPADSPGAHQRAGWPLATAPWAIPSDNGRYVGYAVGGGCPYPRHAEPPTAVEGTWGWDYQGWLLPRRVILGWWHGRRTQGGTGAYQTDGPKLLHHGPGDAHP
jgi:hypothetical protein